MGSITVIQFLGCLFQQNLATNTPRNQIVISQWCRATDETCLLRSFLCIIQFLGPMLANEMPTSTWRNRNASTFFLPNLMAKPSTLVSSNMAMGDHPFSAMMFSLKLPFTLGISGSCGAPIKTLQGHLVVRIGSYIQQHH